MIPDYQTLMRPVLEAAANKARKISDVVTEMEDKFNLTDEERNQLLPSGKQTTIANRTHWARSYLKQAGLVKNIRRGWYEITKRGQKVLADKDAQINSNFLQQFDEFQEFKNRTQDDKSDQSLDTDLSEISTPDENIQIAYQKLNKDLAANLLDAVRNISAEAFEQLIVDVFIAMGYGGTSEGAGRALGRTGDNGVDGVIDQDPLGVDQIYLQAKRYAADNTIGAGHIRDFSSSIEMRKAIKGIFVTTSFFTKSAEETVEKLGKRIILIDGAKLANLMIRYNIGCRTKETLHIKQFDDSFFETDE